MKNKKIVALLLLSGLLAPALSACSSSNSDTLIIRVLNSEDYIYLNDPDNGYDEPDLIDQFAQYIADDETLSAKYGKVQVVYDTADTMENIYSEMLTGKTSYDLICASDYIVAKMARYDLIKKVNKDLIPNYFGTDGKASQALTERLDNIVITKDGENSPLSDYTVGYMWGTLGLLFNPSYYNNNKEGYSVDEIIEDMADISILWDKKYNNSISIKDSMRDTFAFGLMKAYDEMYKDKDGNEHEGFRAMRDKYYVNGGYGVDAAAAYSAYNAEFSDLFNYVISENAIPQNVINDVVKELNTLKKNIFGLEVDSGKQDIVTGKIGINMAWSGDAVYAMDQAEDPEQVTTPHELFYSVPETGSNLWMDCWVAPKLKNQSTLQWELAHEFLNYLCDPSIAAKNMDYTGYTSFIAGDDIVDLVRDWYDPRTDEVYFIDEDETYYDLYAVKDDVSEVTADVLNDGTQSQLIDYEDVISNDGSSGHDDSLDSWKLFYVETENDEETGEINEILTCEELLLEDSEDQKTYGDLTIFDTATDEEGELLYEAVDLTYFFDGTLDEYADRDMVFYSDDYCAFAHEYQEDGGIREICVGRQFYTQYPDRETLARCAVMQDYAKGDQDLNPLIMKMWENFKSDPLPVWAIILFIVLVVLIAVGCLYFFLSKYLNKKLRKKRKQAENN